MQTLDLVDLLRIARTRNTELEVTGLLLYADRSFLQQLEGDPDVVDALFQRIRADERHRDVRIVSRHEIARRSYAGWAMGFGFPEPDHLAEVLPGYEPRFGPPFADDSGLDAGTARLLLAMVAVNLTHPSAPPTSRPTS